MDSVNFVIPSEANNSLLSKIHPMRRFFAAMKTVDQDPLTRPAPAGESAVAAHPLPQGGEGRFSFSCWVVSLKIMESSLRMTGLYRASLRMAEPRRTSPENASYIVSLRHVAPVLFAILSLPLCASAQVDNLELRVTKQFDEPILTINSAGAEGNKYGFEGGRVLKLQDTYHLFTSEMVGDPHWVKMKLAHWISHDRLDWQRASTLFESSGDFTGKDPRAALWSPMPIYDQAERRWNLFYVAYQCAPNVPGKWLNNHEGRIWRAVSKVKGPGGIDGPYEDVGIILQRGKESDAWEGLQGTDSFYPYRVGDKWYAFYGTAHTEVLPISSWQVGLAWAPSLAGPWKRCSQINPLNIEKRFIENPIVTRLPNGSYVAVYDSGGWHAVGYSFSLDGIHWTPGKQLIVQQGKGVWASEVRTPLGLIPEGTDSFTLFYTANQDILGVPPDAQGIKLTPGAVGLVAVKLGRAKAQARNRYQSKMAELSHGKD